MKDSSYHSGAAIIRYLVKAVARNGNLLLDVGPDAHGELAPQAVQSLREIGAWLKINGDAIYATRPVKPYELGNVFFTQKADGTVYAIVLSAKDGEAMPSSVRLPSSLTASAKTISLVGAPDAALPIQPAANGVSEVRLPAASQAPSAGAWVLKITQ